MTSERAIIEVANAGQRQMVRAVIWSIAVLAFFAPSALSGHTDIPWWLLVTVVPLVHLILVRFGRRHWRLEPLRWPCPGKRDTLMFRTARLHIASLGQLLLLVTSVLLLPSVWSTSNEGWSLGAPGIAAIIAMWAIGIAHIADHICFAFQFEQNTGELPCIEPSPSLLPGAR